MSYNYGLLFLSYNLQLSTTLENATEVLKT